MDLTERLRQTVSQRALRIAREILMSQSEIPMSPGAKCPDGAVTYCAAAAVAAAGARMARSEAVGALVRRGVETGSKEAVSDAYDALGWPRRLCLDLMVDNDQADPGKRRIQMAGLIDDACMTG